MRKYTEGMAQGLRWYKGSRNLRGDSQLSESVFHSSDYTMGALFSKKFDPIHDIPDLTGKVVIVTGGNAGIGFKTVQQLSRKGARVYLAARSESKANKAIERLNLEGLGPNFGQVKFLQLDLSDLKGTVASAERFLKLEGRLDVLINNAAILPGETAMTPYGITDIMLVNHIGPFLFTRTLLPLLTRTAHQPDSDVRIISLSSTAHELPPSSIRFSSKEELNRIYDGLRMGSLKTYGATKLANMLFSNELQRRLDKEQVPITVLSLHPGSVRTEGSDVMLKGMLPKPIAEFVLSFLLYSPDEGAHTSVIAATSPAVKAHPELYRGTYLVPIGKIGKKSRPGSSEALAKELWETTEVIVKELGL